MIRLKTVAAKIILLLGVSLGFPLHGSAPTHGGAGGDFVAPFFGLDQTLHHEITSFLGASEQAALAQTSKRYHTLFRNKLAMIKYKVFIPADIDLNEEETMRCVQDILKTNPQSDGEGFYNIPLPCAMKLLTKATAEKMIGKTKFFAP